MGDNEYQEALKLGKKEYKACVSHGQLSLSAGSG